MTAVRTETRPLFIPDQIAAAAGAVALRRGSRPVASVCIDSRAVREGSLFVALPGERTDGHNFLRAAVEAGATALLVAAGQWEGRKAAVEDLAAERGTAVFSVPDTLAGLQALARFHMGRFQRLKRIGITGSNGKTTTKEILGAIVSRMGRAAVNEGNLNSDSGLPLAAFRVDGSHEFAVFEMGMNRQGEMDGLADIVRPDLALITNIGTAHVGILGSREAIAREKKAIFKHFDGRQTGFLGEEEAFSGMLSEGVNGRFVRFGPRTTRGFGGSESLGLDGTAVNWEGLRIRFPLFGRHNLWNALAAIQVAVELGAPTDCVRAGLESVRPLFGRSQIVRGRFTVIWDCYNANPDSMAEALGFLNELSWPGRKVAVLGSMRELGSRSEAAHEAVGGLAESSGLDRVFLFGEEMEAARRRMEDRSGRISWTADMEELRRGLEAFLRDGDLVFVKGSRGLALENLAPTLPPAAAEGTA